DFRWHAFTVMAVILAFGLGVLAGVALPHQSVLLERQQAMIQGLEDDFRSLRADNQRLADWVQRQEERDRALRESAGRLAHLAAAGRLAGREVLLLTRGEVPETLAAGLSAILASAGAEAVWFRGEDPGWRARIVQAPPDGVVLLDDGSDEALEPMVADLRGRLGTSVPLVLATPAEPRAAAVAAQLPQPLTVIDHPQDPFGQVALILGLLGVDGYYGFGSSADGALPPASTVVPVLRGAP
ncbi:MAG TPA: copper transporter, partial [Bacillota bacterium]